MTATALRYALTEVGDGVASVRIATDDAPHVQPGDLVALRAIVEQLRESDRVRALVLEGGERYFSAGADRETLTGDDAAERISALVGEAARLVLDVPVPTVAAMAGHAIGGGWMFGLWCDAALLAEESLYGAPFVELGFTPGMGSTALLPELFGEPLARDLLLTGRILTGAELKAAAPTWSHAIAPRADVRERAFALAHDLARPPPAAVRLTKARLAARRRALLEAALVEEQAMHRQIFDRPETRAHIAQRYGSAA